MVKIVVFFLTPFLPWDAVLPHKEEKEKNVKPLLSEGTEKKINTTLLILVPIALFLIIYNGSGKLLIASGMGLALAFLELLFYFVFHIPLGKLVGYILFILIALYFLLILLLIYGIQYGG
jgi:hypothetical protein